MSSDRFRCRRCDLGKLGRIVELVERHVHLVHHLARGTVQRLREARDRLSTYEYNVGYHYFRTGWIPGAVDRFKVLLANEQEGWHQTVRRLLEPQGVQTISGLQERVLHDPAVMDRLLRLPRPLFALATGFDPVATDVGWLLGGSQKESVARVLTSAA